MKLSVVFAGLLALAGCGPFRRAHAPLPPPTPMPARIPDQVSSTEPAPPPKNLPAPPALPAAKADARAASTAEMSLPGTPTEPPPRPAKPKKAPKKAVAAPPPPVVAHVEPEPEAAPVYRLGELRSPEEKEKLRQQTEQMISICSAALNVAEGKQLSPMQAEMVNRVRSFAAQARETIDKDPGEARSIAAKGRTFAEALLAELK